MQKKWDSLDETIKEAFGEIEVREDYNEQLMMKLHEDNSIKYKKRKVPFLFNENSIAGISFILSGVLMVLIYTSNIQYKLINLASHTSIFSSQYKIDFINNILGVR